ncbi:hypothetical protein [Natronorubrum texcoconense]|uniref:Uncharacterized protein n=1 Tax=Natronorubrum texcoconense TaxID=1095776 RepID=A0A1G9DRM0_9EURY|nr:hypothetical protein [Natronorubrum texcoconense]SDK66460.1 hypothetical protein SAMN04515672_3587 [Natronorubrum texcoconense]
MSDDQSRRSAADSGADASESADDADGDALAPSGGPQRVVSDQSVDDILDSLGETKANVTGSSESPATTADEESTTVEFDEDEVPAAEDAATDTGSSVEADTEPDTDGTETDADIEEHSDDTETDADGAKTDADATSSVDAAASSLQAETARTEDETESIDELAARIETGSVTGADVRAAEAGDGRESTPDVDEIELSMDDLEATQAQSKTGSPSTASGSDLGDDAGPLAGSIPRDDGDSSDDGEDEAESLGLLGRLKRLFGG